ncbi:PACE efflux transporter [Roseovarius amoyensis]|uniref:PACE efflux transporter n=1 Tax=Roseovarius amoyensis TaxID=2211448 RepID=UPI000DBE0197|nr:PACE efflux transporter [Roseovarius amoyensis]
MRGFADRIRHAVCFEVIGLILVTPLGAWLFDKPMFDIGVLALACATIATVWNYIYNLGFDLVMRRVLGHTRKSPLLRVFHAVLFEGGLLVVLMPLIAWYLGVTLWQAFMMDLSFAAFYLIYAFIYNWAYDVIFPIPEQRAGQEG